MTPLNSGTQNSESQVKLVDLENSQFGRLQKSGISYTNRVIVFKFIYPNFRYHSNREWDPSEASFNNIIKLTDLENPTLLQKSCNNYFL